MASLQVALVGFDTKDPWPRVGRALGWDTECVDWDAWLAGAPGDAPDAALVNACGALSPDQWLQLHHMVARLPYPLILVVEGPVPSSFHFPGAGGLRVGLLNPSATVDVVRSTVSLVRQVYGQARETAEAVAASLVDSRRDALLQAVRRLEDDVAHLKVMLAPGVAAAPLRALGEREREVWDWLMRGLSSAAIAQALGISESTVKKHMHAIYRKRGVNGRAQLMAEGSVSS